MKPVPRQENPSPPSPDCSVIVAVYEHADFLEKVLLSLLNQTYRSFEVLIADDGSGDSIPKTIDVYRPSFPHAIRHIRHEDDGFRKTIIVNRAVEAARGDYLVFIDGDCILHHRFLEFHVKRRRRGTVLSGRRVMMNEELSGRVTPEDIRSRRIERPPYWWGKCNRAGYRHGLFLPGVFFWRNLRKRKRCDILGSNFSVHKEDFEYVNGYDERIIGRGLEDDNLSARFTMAGMRLKTIAHEALQYHLFHTSDPIPHSKEIVAQFHFPPEYRTPCGMKKPVDVRQDSR